MPLQLEAIAHIRSPYPEKFSVPRQPGLVESAISEVVFSDAMQHMDAVRGIEQFSHLWLIFAFHQTAAQGWKPLIRPPRLGGNQKIGVFASRSTFRPNPLGLSVVKLISVLQRPLRLQVSGADLVDGTPIYDIKPYIGYADAISDSQSGYAEHAPAPLTVRFSAVAEQQLQQHQQTYADLRQLIQQVLGQDPRPAYQRRQAPGERQYGTALYDLNIRWQVDSNGVLVSEIQENRDKHF
ncbi:tRNA (N6-threonylcarbamoyladenosine(37)-N6)-methyltransferase TrmO [Idiomarina xiamenensis]|uniref:TsaA-like domain-containing protein n=1 Tax=Idiomarina xiamenensis 10-D-4 TaxID=740709 RepID=K2JN02_9GAMM|nr:tRNA (N6-threonylcarbamoyladenosine(37)-N6)-methyltransferase TrmO [Idiomarina xiamenensis]EKE84896.1 hypothetical protein A10D4_04770 [Idiomarina xiamenensis 10-D-4]